jgi:hypothetical protein
MVISGPDKGREFAIPSEGGLVGRGEGCAMRLEDAAVSRQQFRVGVRDGRPLLIDMGSTNKTKVNGEPVDMRPLSPGDRIEIGNSVLQVVGEGDVMCVGDEGVVSHEVDTERTARPVGSGSGVIEVAGFLTAMARLAASLFATDGINAACGHLGGAVSAERVQLVSVDGGIRLLAGRGGAQGTVPVDRARLEKVARSGKAICMRGNEHEIMMSPVLGEGVLVVDRPAGHAWDRGTLELVAATSQVFAAAMAATSERSRRERAAADLSDDGELDGDSAIAARLRDWVAWVAPKPFALLLGETGVGKERIAAAIHDKGPRSTGPFVVVHCVAMSEAWLEADVFGHEDASGTRRAGKLEAAHGGVIFFDELAALPPRCQKKLMQVIERRAVKRKDGTLVPADVHVIAASCHDIAGMVNVQAVRPDLYERLAQAMVVVPPLRERRADLVTIAEKMLYRLAADASQRRTGFAADAAARLASSEWPGNLRELKNVVERLLLQPGDDPVSAADVDRAMTRRH